jgi:hypothetical protein
VATTSSGHFRRPSLWFAGAAALAAVALLKGTDPHVGSASKLRERPAPAREGVTAVAVTSASSIPRSPPELSISADVIERELYAANPGTRDLVLERTLTRWTHEDPRAAARFAELQTDPFLREVALRTVAQVWAQNHPETAAQWSASLGDAAERSRVIEGVALTVGNTDPHAALDLLVRHDAGTRPGATHVGVIASWASRDFAAAQSWVEAQPPSSMRDDAVQHLAFLRAQTDPLAAARLASEMLGDETARHDAYASIIRVWVARDPDGARQWAAYAEGETRRRVEAELALLDENSSAN